MTEQAEAYVRNRAEIALLLSAIVQYRSSKQAPLLVRPLDQLPISLELIRKVAATAERDDDLPLRVARKFVSFGYPVCREMQSLWRGWHKRDAADV